ncbi:MAG: hypothetical protein CMJ64_23285 [Planctomycetaceae bacterium]|nr:hypothetical protein [Planctomycetaceae bacterium]
MTSQHDDAKPWQFSLCVLMVIVTLSAIVAALWPTPIRSRQADWEPPLDAVPEDELGEMDLPP